MYYTVSFDARKCAKQNVPSEIFGFWDRGEGNKFVVKNIPSNPAIGNSFILNKEISNRNLMTEFKVSHFVIKDIKERFNAFNVDFREIVLEPIFIV